MSRGHAYGRLLGLVIAGTVVYARTVHVPAEAPTIQAGLDSLQNGDTVFVARGTYEERLVGRPFAFAMMGEWQEGDTLRPLVDGASVAGPDTLSVLALPDFARAVIENFRFKNGVRNGIHSWADEVTLRNCVLDSVDEGFYQMEESAGALVTLENCEFRDNGRFCAFAWDNTLCAVNCEFSCRAAVPSWPLAGIRGHGSVLRQCRFRSNFPRIVVSAWGGPNFIVNCTFGPIANASQVLDTRSFYGRIEGNIFQDCEYEQNALSIYADYPDSVEVRNNLFLHCTATGPPAQASGTLFIVVWDTVMDRGVLVEGNTFIDCAAEICGDDLFTLRDKTRVIANRFMNDSLNGLPSVYTESGEWATDSVILRDNLFINCGYAAHGNSYLDARWNWWGDSTGPYHVTENRYAHGDTVTGTLQFSPWYADTLFMSASNPAHTLPKGWELTLHPNPFNQSVALVLAGFTGQDFEIGLYNLLGQIVDVVHQGALTGGQLHYQAPPWLASGVYLLSARDKHSIQTKKVILMK